MIVTVVTAAALAVFIIWLFFNPRFPIYSVSRGSRKQKMIALTFDDGPSTDRTESVLKILKKQKIKATFFVVGEHVQKYPDIVKRINSDGHMIGNHSSHHVYSLWWSASHVLRDADNTNRDIHRVIGAYPRYFRPPFGLRTPWGARALKNAGYHIVTWDNMTYDYFGMPRKKLTETILRHAKPGGIIVLHDGRTGMGAESTHMIESLNDIIDELKRRGYSFVRVDEMFDDSSYRKK